MNAIASSTPTQDIVVDEILPHAPAVVWAALTDGALMGRWLMEPSRFEAVPGNRFTFKTTPAGAWDGLIRCEVLEVVREQRFAFAWRGGHEANEGYGSRLDTVVTFTLTPAAEGTRLRLVHSGFVVPSNDVALRNMSQGWVKCVDRLRDLSESKI